MWWPHALFKGVTRLLRESMWIEEVEVLLFKDRIKMGLEEQMHQTNISNRSKLSAGVITIFYIKIHDIKSTLITHLFVPKFV